MTTDRKLAAILAADVVGYSRLMEADEAGTFDRLQAHRKELFEPEIGKYHGRIFKLMGDGLLAEFGSVVDAVECAVLFQRAMAQRNTGLADDQRIDVRMGINLGDVIVEGEDRHGDGVNIAVRLEGLADAGGIILSGTAYDQLKKKIDVGFEFLGEQQVKNIAEPVRVYRVLIDRTASGKTIGAASRSRLTRRRPAIAAAVLLLAVAIGAAVWLRPWEPRFEPELPLPDKPSIAVLPFANMSGDPDQDYFADGMVDDLITDLSRISGLFVIARNSTFAYKNKSIDLRQVARELGVRYVLEGSIRRSGDQVRINAQLIDASTGGHQWAERYDGSVANIFALQDKVTNAIVDALALRLVAAEQLSLSQPDTAVPAAYDAFLRGWDHYRRTTPEDYAKAIPYFEEAIKLDSDYGRAYAAIAMVYLQAYYSRWTQAMGISRNEVRSKARRYLQEAQKHPSALAHHATASLYQTDWMHEPALAELKEAIALEPGEPWSYADMAWILTSAGRPAEALPHIRTAMRLDPRYPSYFAFVLGLAQFSLENFEEAAMALEDATERNPDFDAAFLLLGATYGHLGRDKDAASAIARSNEVRIKSGNVPVTIANALPLDLSKKEDHERFLKGLRLAGVPETLFEGEFAARNRLAPDEVRALFFGKRLRGRTIDSGEEHEATITQEGVATLTGDWASMGGGTMAETTIRFDGDEVCFRWQGTVSYCGTAFRNPGGLKAKENEFIWSHGNRAFTFSPEN